MFTPNKVCPKKDLTGLKRELTNYDMDAYGQLGAQDDGIFAAEKIKKTNQ